MGRTAFTELKKKSVCGWKDTKKQEAWRNLNDCGVFVCMVSDIRNKMTEEHISGKISDVQHMSSLPKVFHG